MESELVLVLLRTQKVGENTSESRVARSLIANIFFRVQHLLLPAQACALVQHSWMVVWRINCALTRNFVGERTRALARDFLGSRHNNETHARAKQKNDKSALARFVVFCVCSPSHIELSLRHTPRCQRENIVRVGHPHTLCLW